MNPKHRLMPTNIFYEIQCLSKSENALPGHKDGNTKYSTVLQIKPFIAAFEGVIYFKSERTPSFECIGANV